MNRKGLFLIVITLVAFALFTGCMSQKTTVDMEISITADDSDLGKDQIPFNVSIVANNAGSVDAPNVQADVIFSYQDQVIQSQIIDFGDIPAGGEITRDEVILVSFPAGHPPLTQDDLGITLGIYADGKKQEDVTVM